MLAPFWPSGQAVAAMFPEIEAEQARRIRMLDLAKRRANVAMNA
jgi:hypothetical protein